MSSIDMYRSNVNRKREELVRLSEQKAREQNKIASISSKIQSAIRSMNSSSSISSIQNRQKEIVRYQEDISKLEKAIADIENKIAQKNKDLAYEQKKLSDEEIRESKRASERSAEFQKQQQQSIRRITNKLQDHETAIKSLANLPKEITVLFFASNPRDQMQLYLDEEVRAINEMILKSKHRDSVKLESAWAVRPGDILQYTNQYNPTIVHFSGHGSENDELVLMDNYGGTKLVSMESIVQAMRVANDNLRLVFFNTCFSRNQARNVAEYIDAAIGMNVSITDNAARIFSAQFYSSIGFGLSIERAFNQAKAAIMLEGIKEEDTPELFIRDGISASDIVIVAVE
jgi:hypothetical protein